MQKTPPTRGRLAVMVLFALSCFAILLYIWKAFGGPSPLAAERYEFSADFREASQLSDTADVRISGVNVGRVKQTELHGRRTRALIEIEARYAPIPSDTRAILRQKTLLGETYIELSPGDEDAPPLPDGGRLRTRQVHPTVELDEVTRALDSRSRSDLQRLVRALGTATGSRPQALSDVLGNLPPFAGDTTRLLEVLDSESAAVRRLVRDSGVVFDALGRRQGQLSGLVRSGDRVLAVTARRNRDLADVVRILPTTLAELRPTLLQVETVAEHAAPLVRELRPAARSLGPTLVDASALAPDLKRLFGDLDRVVTVSRSALPALQRIVEAARPAVPLVVDTLKEAAPVVDYLGLYKQEVVTTFSVLAASTQASERGVAGGEPLHYVRALVPFTAEGPLVQDRRFGTNRPNPYLRPMGLLKLGQGGVESFSCAHAGNPGSGEPAYPCKEQEPLPWQGAQRAYPHVEAAP
jgi:virulence factor Mce-like protein